MATPRTYEPALTATLVDLASEAGVSRDSLARACGMSADALDRAMRGRGRFPVSALIGAARTLGMRASDVLARAEAVNT